MAALALAKPEERRFQPARLQRAFDLPAHWAKSDKVPAAALCAGRGGTMVEPHFFGRLARPGHGREHEREPIVRHA